MEAEKTTLELPITFTEGAIKKISEIKAEQKDEVAPYLRIGVKGGGCSGLSYLLAYDQKEEADIEYLINEIPVIMNKAHAMYVLGMEVDYEYGLNTRGFTFNNPNASETCGCGESFST
ncbi:MAG: iron-sulfur cluster assembly protein [Bacteroidia bacterium]|jgi:iron-sulfur cluster assembly protein